MGGTSATFSSSVTSSQFISPSNLNNSQLNTGSVEIQSYVVNNSWVGDNVYYNGTNFTRRNAGYASQLYFETSGAIAFFTSPSAAAGTTPSFVRSLTLTNTGAATFSSSVSVGGYLTGTGVNPGGLGGSRYLIDFSGNYSRFFSYGINNATNGGFLFNSQRSDGTNSLDFLTIAPTGAATFSSSIAATGVVDIKGVGSNTLGSGPYLEMGSPAGNRYFLEQLNASDGCDFWYYNGSSWAVKQTFNSDGNVKFIGLAGSGSRAVLADANGLLSAPVSDISVKENIKPLDYGIADIMKLKPVSFEYIKSYKNYGKGKQIGNIAQDMAKVIPEAVFTTPSTGKMGINYDQLNGVYIKALQELQLQNEALIKRIETLENK